MSNNESRLNDTINKIFDYMDWYREYEKAPTDRAKRLLCLKHSNEVSGQLLESKKKCETYFEDVVDQPIYLTQDYLRLRKFLIHWYAAYNCAVKEKQQISDIAFVDKSLLLQSLGYTLYAEHGDLHQKTLCTQLSDMYAQKGTPLCIAKALSLLDISNFTIFEYWLERDPSDNILIFKPTPIDDISYSTGFVMDATPVKPYQAVVEKDCHWYLTEEEIEAAEANNELGLPSMTPYIGVISANDWVKNSKKVMAFVNRIVTSTYDKFKNEPGYDLEEAKKYYFYMTGENISLLELYLAIGYTYNIIYNRTTEPTRNNIDERVPHYNGEESTLTSEVQYITEFNEIHKRTFDRDERETMLKNDIDNWQTLNPITSWTHAQASIVLEEVSPAIKELCDNMIASLQGYELLKDLLLVLDYYVKHDIGLTSYTSLFMLYDPLEENKEKLKRVLNFFKPYQTRLIEAISYLVIDDIPGDCFAVKEVFRQRIFEKFFDYYNYLKDLLRQRIFDKHFDIAGRPECDTMFDDLLAQIIIDKHFDVAFEVEDKIVKLDLKNLFVEIYTLYDDAVEIAFRSEIGRDRIGFNEMQPGGSLPFASSLIKIVRLDRIDERLREDYYKETSLKLFTFIKNLFVDWYTLYTDVAKIAMEFQVPSDRIGFNEMQTSDSYPIPSAIIKAVNMDKVVNRIKDRFSRDTNIKLIDLMTFRLIDIVEYEDDPHMSLEIKLPIDRLGYNEFAPQSDKHWPTGSIHKDTPVETVYDKVDLGSHNKSRDTYFFVEKSIVYKDAVEIIVNEAGQTIFLDSNWVPSPDGNVITYSALDNPDIPDVVVSVRDLYSREVKVVNAYNIDSIDIKASQTFSGKIVFSKVDFRIDFEYQDWTYEPTSGMYEYFIDPLLYGMNPADKHMLTILNQDNEGASVNIQHYPDGSITLRTTDPFNGKVLILIGEVNKVFNNTSDWTVSGTDYKLIVNPYELGLDPEAPEYMVSVRDADGKEVSLEVKYDYSGVVMLSSKFKISGTVVISE